MKRGIRILMVLMIGTVFAAAGCSDLGGNPKTDDDLDSPIAYYFFNELVTVGSDQVDQNDYSSGAVLNAVSIDGATVAVGGKYLDDLDGDNDTSNDVAHTGVFDGINDYFEITDLTTGLNSDFTVTAWINPANTSDMPIISKHTADGTGDASSEFFLGIVSSKLTLILGNSAGGAVTVTGTANIPASTWTFVAVSVSGTTISLLVNPEDQAYPLDDNDFIDSAEFDRSGTYSGTRQSGNLPVQIGRYNNGAAAFFNGNIDQVRLFGAGLVILNDDTPAVLDAGAIGFIYESEK